MGARVRLQHPQRPKRRLLLRGRELDHLARRLPASGGAAHSQTSRELGVGRGLWGPDPAQCDGDRACDGLELFVAAFADEVLLEVTQTRLVARLFLEDRSVPEECAGGIVAGHEIEV